MQSKSTVKPVNQQELIAGICQEDSSIEFFGIKKTRKVKFMTNGKTYNFNELKGKPAAAIAAAFSRNEPAKLFFARYKENGKPVNHARKLELFVFFNYGGLDHQADYKDGRLQTVENYRTTEYCPSLCFKSLRIDGQELTSREIMMLDCYAKDYTNTRTAGLLGITLSTFDYHNRNLLIKANVITKTALMIKAAKQGLLC